MADERKIVIEILSNENQVEEPEAEPEKEEKPKIAFFEKAKKFFTENYNAEVGYMIASTALSSIEDFVEKSFMAYNSLTEDYISSNVFTGVKAAVSLTTGVLNSMAVGARVAGPYGAIAGAAIGVAGAAIQSRNSYVSARINLNETEMQVGFNADRLGLIDGGRGTLN